LKTTPRGLPKGHPRDDLLRRKSLTGSVLFGTPEWLGTDAALDRVRTAWNGLRDLVSWLEQFVGGQRTRDDPGTPLTPQP